MIFGDLLLAAVMLGLSIFWLGMATDGVNPKDRFTRVGAAVLGVAFGGVGFALLLPAGSL